MNNILDVNQFKEAKPIVDKLVSKNFQAYYVGGCVRDFLLNQDINDIDITTSALPEEIQAIFPNVIPVGIEHGTVIVRFHDQSYEVTTFRSDKGNLRLQNHQIQLIDDLRLRDFTMNAIAMDLNGNIYDYYQGVKDIQDKKVRLVANDESLLINDPLRILRAFRFAAQLNFMLNQDTFSKIIKNIHLINTVKIERLHNEWIKLITAKHLTGVIEQIIKSNLMSYLPIFKDNPSLENIFGNITSPFYSFAHFIAYMHFLMPKISIHSWCNEWKVAKHEKHAAFKLIELLTYTKNYGIDAYSIYQLPENLADAFSSLMRNILKRNHLDLLAIHKMRQALPIQSRNELQLNGNDLIKLFPHLEKGSWIKEMLEKIEKQVVLSKLKNEFNAIKEWVLCNPPNQK